MPNVLDSSCDLINYDCNNVDYGYDACKRLILLSILSVYFQLNKQKEGLN